MRIAIGQLWQETNTFNPLPTTRANFEAFGVLRGAELIERLADTNEPGGFIQSLRAWRERPEIVGLVRLPAWPSGVATRQTFAWLRGELLDALDAAEPVDGVLLALHGALVADGEPDVEGAVLEAVRERARRLAAEVAGEVWRCRDEYLPALVGVEEAVARAAEACRGGLVVLSDSADATTSGAPGDSTHLLRELLRYDWPRPVLVTLVDPDLVRDMADRPAGTVYAGPVGGKRDARFSTPLPVRMERTTVFDARFVLSGHLGRNLPIDMGRAVVLRDRQVHVIVTERTGPHFAPELFRAAGFDPFAASVLVAKSPCGFRAAYQDRAALILVVRTPGCAPADFWNYEYHHIPRPLWPWNRDLVWRPEPVLLAR